MEFYVIIEMNMKDCNTRRVFAIKIFFKNFKIYVH